MLTRILPIIGLALLAAGCGSGGDDVNPSGTLEATEVDIASVIAGRVAEVRVRLGDHVQAGDTLVLLDTDLLRLQREQAAAGKGSIAAQRLVTQDNLAQAERTLELAESTLVRIRALLEQGSATGQQLDEAQTKRDLTSMQMLAAQHQLRALDAEEEKLDALLSVYDRQLRDGAILAPAGGSVILRSAEPGETAAPGTVLLRLAQLNDLELRVFLAQADLARVRIGQELPVLVDAFPGDSLTGKVTWISPEAEFTPKNVQTRNARSQLVYAVKLSIPNPEGRLHIGMPAEVIL